LLSWLPLRVRAAESNRRTALPLSRALTLVAATSASASAIEATAGVATEAEAGTASCWEGPGESDIAQSGLLTQMMNTSVKGLAVGSENSQKESVWAVKFRKKQAWSEREAAGAERDEEGAQRRG